MARRVRTIVVIVALGAMVNVLVAWGLAWNDPVEAMATHHNFQLKWRNWDYVHFNTWKAIGGARATCGYIGPDARVSVSLSGTSPSDPAPPLESVIPKWAEPALPRLLDSNTACYMRICDFRGWPFLSMASECEDVQETGAQAAANNFQSVRHLKGCMTLSDRPNRYWAWWESPRLLPLRPLWPGFAINTMLYAATLWLFWTTPFALRRRRRMKRHLCPACAYPVVDSPTCTECGAAVQPRRIPIPS